MMRRILLMFALAAGLACAADISGTWAVTVEVQGNTGTPTFVLKQMGETLTGTYTGLLGEAPVTGTVQGNNVELSFESKSDQAPGKIVYKGKIDGDKMKGTLSLSGLGEGTWEATKKK